MIDACIADKLCKIGSNMYDVTYAVHNALTKTSGEVVRVDDVSGTQHKLGISLKSKNLIFRPYLNDTSKEEYGITYTLNEDGTLLVNGTTTATSSFRFANALPLEDGKTYWFRDVTGGLPLVLSYKDASGTTQYKSTKITWSADYTMLFLYLQVRNTTVDNVLSSPMFIEGETATTVYTPHISDFSGSEVSRYGKNLLNFHSIVPNPGTVYISTYENGVLKTQSSSSNTKVCSSNRIYLPTGVPLCYSHTLIAGDDRVIIQCYDKDDNNISANISIGWGTYNASYLGVYGAGASGCSFILPSEVDYIQLAYAGMKTDAEFNEYTNFQIEAGTAATDYEPYTEPQTAISSADGMVEGLTSISPTMTLIPDTAGVNVTCKYFTNSNEGVPGKYKELMDAIKAARDMI